MKKIYGVGINDADYRVKITEELPKVGGRRVRRIVWICPFFQTWRNMLARCYSEAYLLRNPTYKDCYVCDEWLTFSSFKSWMEKQEYEGKQLDKDLLVKGNKVYGTDTCVFITKRLNTFISERTASRGQWPIGVYWSEKEKKFHASINVGNNRSKSLKYHATPEEAHQAWLKAKLELAKELAAEQDDPRVAKALVEGYENYDYL